jgi:RimJ/RimL family protein N-acetyltransferase
MSLFGSLIDLEPQKSLSSRFAISHLREPSADFPPRISLMKPFCRLSELTEDWRFYLQRDGFPSALRLIAAEIAQLPYRRLKLIVLARSLLEPFPEWEPKIQLSIRPFERADLELVRRIDRPSEARLCMHRLDEGHIGLMAFCDDRPAGYAWGSTDIHTRLERVHPKLYPGDVLCTDSFTSPEFRGLGIQTALTLARFYLFRQLGYKRVICYIEVSNKPSLAVWQRKFDSQYISTIDFKRIGPWYKVSYC